MQRGSIGRPGGEFRTSLEELTVLCLNIGLISGYKIPKGVGEASLSLFASSQGRAWSTEGEE